MKAPYSNHTTQQEIAVERTKELIQKGRISRGSYLPSIRKASELFQVNRDAVWRAYVELEKSNVLEATDNGRYRVHPSIAESRLRVLDVRLIAVGEFSIRFSGLQRFHKHLVDNENRFGIRTHLQCATDARNIDPQWFHSMDCVVFGGYFENPERLATVDPGIPSIGIINSEKWTPNLAIDTDNQHLGRLAASHLRERGANAPALVAYSNQEKRRVLRKLGFQSQWLEDGGAIEDILEHWIDPSCPYQRIVDLNQIAQSLDSRDSVFCLEKQSAIDLLNILKRLEVDIPSNLKVISADGTFEGLATTPPLTYLKQNFERMAEITAERIRLACSDSSEPPRFPKHERILVRPELVQRQST